MFTLANNKEIGQYLISHIDKQFKSRRQFCKAYLIANGEPADNEQIRNMSNRLSQILIGKKEIQLYDLPLFCQLLKLSCEDILSAGTSPAPTSAHLTNYTAAFSKDDHEWEAYLNCEDSPVLNADEYGKTFIDYALEARNYDLLKYMMDKQYIWFVGADEKDYGLGFGAGTSIERAALNIHNHWNVLDAQLKMRDELRTQMIALAIQHKDMEMLEQLHAREIPFLYRAIFHLSMSDYKHYYNETLMEALTHADNDVLEYFSKEFEITDQYRDSNKFLFPFIAELIERLLQAKNEFAEYLLRNAIQHNQYVYDQLVSLLAEAVQAYRGYGYDTTDTVTRRTLTKCILGYLHFHEDGSFVHHFGPFPEMKRGLKSNIVRVNAESADPLISRRILELNNLYDAIHNIVPKFD